MDASERFVDPFAVNGRRRHENVLVACVVAAGLASDFHARHTTNVLNANGSEFLGSLFSGLPSTPQSPSSSVVFCFFKNPPHH